MIIKHEVIRKNVEGIEVVYVKSPNSLTSYVGFHSLAGAYAENDANNGVSHYLEHMFFKGTKKRDWEDIVRQGALLGAQQNAYTGTYEVCYYLEGFPQENLAQSIDLLSDMMFNSELPEAEFKKEKTVILEEIKMREDDHDIFFYDSATLEFGAGQTRRKVIGTAESVNALSRDGLMEYYRSMYTKDNTIFLVIGSLPEEEVFSTCKTYFVGNPMPDTGAPEIDPVIFGDYGKEVQIRRVGIQQCKILEIFKTFGIEEERNCQLMSFYKKIMGGGMNSLLCKEIREKRGLCYGIGMYGWSGNQHDGNAVISSSIDPSNITLFRDTVSELKADVIKNGFKEDDFVAATNSLLGGFYRHLEAPYNSSGAMARHILFGNELDFQRSYDCMMSVTLEELNAFATKMLTDQKTNWFSMVPEVSE